MPILLIVLGIFAPRFVIALLWLLSSWFEGVFETRLWPILGFLFLPLTLLWYSVVENWFAGEWGALQIVVLVIAVIADMSTGDGARRSRS